MKYQALPHTLPVLFLSFLTGAALMPATEEQEQEAPEEIPPRASQEAEPEVQRDDDGTLFWADPPRGEAREVQFGLDDRSAEPVEAAAEAEPAQIPPRQAEASAPKAQIPPVQSEAPGQSEAQEAREQIPPIQSLAQEPQAQIPPLQDPAQDPQEVEAQEIPPRDPSAEQPESEDGSLFWSNPPRGDAPQEFGLDDLDGEYDPLAPAELQQPEERPEPVEIENPRDFYVVAGVGLSDLRYSEGELENGLGGGSGITPNVDDVDDSDIGFKFYAGYRVHERVALELGFVDLGSVRSSFDFIGPAGSEAAVEQAIRDEHAVLGNGITAGVRAYLLDGSDFDVSAKLGAFFWDAETEVNADFNGAPLDFVSRQSGTDLFYGLGVHYDIAEDWALQLEYELYNIDDETAGQIALSARYAFDL